MTTQQRAPEGPPVTVAPPFIRKPFASSILLWVRTDQPRQKGMDYWKGPHSKIISATPGFDEYRQIHLAESNPGLWPAIRGVETTIPADRKIDGVAEVTFRSVFSPLFGQKQTKLAYKDEINVFRRTLLYAGPPYSARWYTVNGDGAKTGSRALIYLRKKDGVGMRAFRKFISDEFVGAVASTGVLKELRTQVFMPWSEKLWDTPNVAHDNPRRSAFPRLADPRLHRRQRAPSILRQRRRIEAVRQAALVRLSHPCLRDARSAYLCEEREGPVAI